jgi:spermidine/putrescine transport system substrate-binding protein
VTTDYSMLNQAIVEGRIGMYVSGGTYTIARARLEGHEMLRAITPRHGPIDGRGGIVFMEVTSIMRHTRHRRCCEDFLDYLLTTEGALAVAMAGGSCSPIAQMGISSVMRGYEKKHFDAIQWGTLEEDISRCAAYAIAPSYPALYARLVAARERTTTRRA